MTEEIQNLTAAEARDEHTSTNHADAIPSVATPSDEDTLKSTHTPESEAPPLIESVNPESFLPEPSASDLSADDLAPIAPAIPVESEPAPVAESAPTLSATSRPNLAVSALSDVGCVRTNNEDAYGYDSELGIFVICDGMGGMAAGEVASSNAVAALVNTFAESAGTGLPIGTRLQQAVHTANSTVWEMGKQPEHKGMGTTSVASALDGHKLVIANVGDSRAYAVQNGVATQITVDHSYINELIRNGTLTKENAHLADLHGYESVITRAIGVSETVEPDYYAIDLTPGTQILLATDGLTRYLNEEEIATIVQATPFESTCANLIDLAKRRGGHDNITCVLLLVLPPESAATQDPQPAA
ncbi:Stp1/IreP family PP2C-type Ser/Thr phosphatase [Terracidiphilus sp.]|jgi:protein phosphatase|uniref:Stp1/IreP family PP2C-type Ser/Thr phosphatase n=1 Tax=Terracidiphilus sp. TaxID=1964191 RepID=UPI003C16B61A